MRRPTHSTFIRAGRNAYLAKIMANPYKDPHHRALWEKGYNEAKIRNERYILILTGGPKNFKGIAAEKGGTPEDWYQRALIEKQPFHPEVAKEEVPILRPAPPIRKGKAPEGKYNRPHQPRQQPPRQQPAQPKQQHRHQPRQKGQGPRGPRQVKNTIGQNLTYEERRGLWATAKKAEDNRSRPASFRSRP